MGVALEVDDGIRTRGPVEWIIRDAKGRFVKRGRGRLVNKTNNNALAAYAQWGVGVANVGAGNVIPYPTQMQLGTGTGTPASNDSGLFTAAAGTEVAITSYSVYKTYYSQYVAYWGSSTPTGNYTEAVLLDPNGLCWAHVLLQTSASQPYVPIKPSQTLTIIWRVQFQGN